MLSQQDEDAMARVRELKRSAMDALDWIIPALERSDLTVPEALRLANLYQHHKDVMEESLLKEKALIEQKRRPEA